MTELARHYPRMPPSLPGESTVEYTNRLSNPERAPYDHSRNRQCSIGFHEECSDQEGTHCKCPCHYVMSPAPRHDDPVLFAIVWPDRKPYEDWLEATGVMFYNRVTVIVNVITGATTLWPDINILMESIADTEGLGFVWLDGL
jgi:hypothetical protein